MKVPPEAVEKLLASERDRRDRIAEEEAREAAAAFAREAAAVEIAAVEIDGGFAPAGRGRGAPDRSRTAPVKLDEIIDQVFGHLARRRLRAPWEMLARSASSAGAGELGRALDRLALALGTAQEADCRVEVALAASMARTTERQVEDEAPRGPADWKDALLALAHQSRVQASLTLSQVVLERDRWLAIDERGGCIEIEPDTTAATLAGLLARGAGPIDLEIVLARSEALGSFAVPVRATLPESRGAVRLA